MRFECAGLLSICMMLCVDSLSCAQQEAKYVEHYAYKEKSDWSTLNMGGVEVSPDQLQKMRAGDYILHAKDGQLNKIPVEKIRLPLDPSGHVQRLGLFVAGPDRAIYATQTSVMSKSTDGGKTWKHLRRKVLPDDKLWPDNHFFLFRVLNDGTWIQGKEPEPSYESGHVPGQATMYRSSDEGQTWEEAGHIKVPGTKDLRIGSISVLADGTLNVVIVAVFYQGGKDKGEWEDVKTLLYQSKDGGKTFLEPSLISHWGHETNVSELPSGDFIATIRYQRKIIPSDPPNIAELTGAVRYGSSKWPFKHAFFTRSTDRGKTWGPVSQVTTELGQCYCEATGLSDGRIVLTTDSRYPRPMSGARALVTDDGGKTWRDEVYYLSNGTIAGYAETISLDGKEMLTLTGAFYGGEDASWREICGGSKFSIIRWRLED